MEYFVDVEAKLIRVPDSRYYSTPHGTFPSATTILSAKAKGGLTSWQINMAQNGLDPKELSRQAMDRGSKVHGACESWMKGETLEFYNPETGAENYDLYGEWVPILNFIKAFEELEIEPILIEQNIYSIKHGFAGTMDLLCMLKPDKKSKAKVLALVDLKTSAAAYVDYHWQLAAYQNAFMEMMEINSDFAKHVHAKANLTGSLLYPFILLLKVDTTKGWRLTEVENAHEKFENFLACKKIWSAEHKDFDYWRALYPTTLKRNKEIVNE